MNLKGRGAMTAKRILHVDDTWECRRLVSAVLKHAGYEVIEAEDGLQGVALAKQELPHLILMDLHLPDISGLEATEQIKRLPELAHVAIIAVTATEK
jgi:CheY-like chemotaxis protein